MAKSLQDDAMLYKLCREGNLRRVKDFVEKLDDDTLKDKLRMRRGVSGYTPLHEAVASGKAEVLDYLLERTKNVPVNCRANNGYTPLHLAARSGHRDCVKELLEHAADIFITDEHGKTPVQLASKANIVHLLRSESKYLARYTVGALLIGGRAYYSMPEILGTRLSCTTQHAKITVTEK